MIKALIIIALCAFSASAQVKKSDFFKPYAGIGSVSSSAVCFGGSSSDIISSQGLQERNRLFRNSRGELSNGKAILSFAPCGISYAFEKRHPKAVIFFRFAFGAVRFGAAVHNWRQR